MTDQELLNYREQGFIPGPDESEEAFIARIEECKTLHFEEYPLEKNSNLIAEAFPITKKLFGIAPHWIQCLFSNHEMMPWHGGCAWIFKKDENSPTASFIQLRKEWKNKSRLFGIYRRQELIAHEISHVGRMTFDEPIYEELFAYLTSTSKFHRYFGPLVRSSYESMAFVVTLFTLIVVDGVALFSGYFELYEDLQFLKLIPIGMLFFALIRLFYTHKKFLKASKVIGGHKFLYSLTDEEITTVSSLEPVEVTEWIEENSKSSLRFRQLLLWMRL